MKKQFVNFLCAILLLSLMACGGGAEKKENTENKSENKTSDKKEESKASAGKAESCQENNLILTGDGDYKLAKFEVKGIQIYRDLMESDKVKYPALILNLSNYPKSGDYVSDPTNAGDVRLIINFSGKAGSKIENKVYPFGAEGFGKNDAASANFSTKDRSYTLNLPNGKAEITYLGDDKVCGTVDVSSKDGKTTIKGNFSIPLK